MDNIKQVLELLGIEYKTSGHKDVRNGWIGLHCPYCSRHNRYYLGVNLSSGQTVCWYCGGHGLAGALTQISGASYQNVCNALEGIGWDRVRKKERTGLKIPNGVDSMKKIHRKYLKDRGLNPDDIETNWGVKGIGLAEKLSWRLFIPVYLNGEVVSWTTRTIGNKEPRYISAGPDEESVALKSILYGSDYAKNSVVVCEGPIDVWRIGYGAVATCGIGFSDIQITAIGTYPIRAICFDNEPRAQVRARKLADCLHMIPGETIIIELETGKDPGDADMKEILEIREKFLV